VILRAGTRSFRLVGCDPSARAEQWVRVETGVNKRQKRTNYGERDDALLLDLDAGKELLLEYIRLIEEQDQMDVSQEGAGTDRIEGLEGIVDSVHLGTRVSVTTQIDIDARNAAHHGVPKFAMVSLDSGKMDMPASKTAGCFVGPTRAHRQPCVCVA